MSKNKKHQVEVIELFLAKLAALCLLSPGLKIFPIQLINFHKVHLARILKYVRPLVMATLLCISLLHTLHVKTFDNSSKLYDFLKSAKYKVRFPKLAISSK